VAPVAEIDPNEAHEEAVREWIGHLERHQRIYGDDPGAADESWRTLAYEHGIKGKNAIFSPIVRQQDYRKRAEEIIKGLK